MFLYFMLQVSKQLGAGWVCFLFVCFVSS